MTTPKAERTGVDEILEIIGASDMPKEARALWAANQALQDWPCLEPIKTDSLPESIKQPQKELTSEHKAKLIERALAEVDPKLMQECVKAGAKQAQRPPNAIKRYPGGYLIEPDVGAKFGHT